MLLSDFVRLYQALDQAGIPVKLDIYKGMPHVFQTFFFHNTTESNIAISKTSDFLRVFGLLIMLIRKEACYHRS